MPTPPSSPSRALRAVAQRKRRAAQLPVVGNPKKLFGGVVREHTSLFEPALDGCFVPAARTAAAFVASIEEIEAHAAAAAVATTTAAAAAAANATEPATTAVTSRQLRAVATTEAANEATAFACAAAAGVTAPTAKPPPSNSSNAFSGSDTPLVEAVIANDPAAIHALVAAKADVDQPSRRRGGHPPLTIAVLAINNSSALLAVLECKADPNRTNAAGAAAVHVAARRNLVGLLLLLLDAKADPDQLYRDGGSGGGVTAATIAASAGAVDALQSLLDHNADVQGGRGRCSSGHPGNNDTPLLRAAAADNRQCVHVLLTHARRAAREPICSFVSSSSACCRRHDDDDAVVTAVVNARDSKGRTPLIVAAQRGAVELCATLLAHGAAPLARDDSGYTAAATARLFHNTAVVELLESFPLATRSCPDAVTAAAGGKSSAASASSGGSGGGVAGGSVGGGGFRTLAQFAQSRRGLALTLASADRANPVSDDFAGGDGGGVVGGGGGGGGGGDDDDLGDDHVDARVARLKALLMFATTARQQHGSAASGGVAAAAAAAAAASATATASATSTATATATTP
jgi:ankyrin repeat protein